MWQTTVLLLWRNRQRTFYRAHKDKRQRTAVLLALGIFVYLAFYGVYLFKNPAAAVVLMLGAGVAALIRRGHRREDETFPTLIAAPPIPVLEEQRDHSENEQQLLLLWLLYGRALSELFLHNNPETVYEQVATRRVLLARIRELGLDEAFSSEERDMHFKPDRGWTRDEAVRVIARGAELEAMLWAAGKRSVLQSIEDLNRVVAIPAPGRDDLSGLMQFSWRDVNDLRVEAYAATAAWLRMLAEAHRRGIADVGLASPELLQSVQEIAAEGGNQSTDLVLGTKLVTECSEKELRIAIEQVGMRNITLRRLIGETESVNSQSSDQWAE